MSSSVMERLLLTVFSAQQYLISIHADRSDQHSMVWRLSLSVLVVEAHFG